MTRSVAHRLTGGDLAAMWRDAAMFLPHLAGCACLGAHVLLDRDAVEADLVAYLAESYRAAGRATLARLVAAREHAAGPRMPFAAWLAALDAAPLEAGDHERLLADLGTALQSLASARPGGFVCE